jgi:hypothetical protein
VATNQQVGEKFSLTYSAVSQRVSVIKEMLYKDKKLNWWSLILLRKLVISSIPVLQ